MLDYLNRLKIGTKLHLLVGFLISGLIILGLLSYFVTEKIKINGIYYNEIINILQVTGDIEPSPGDLVLAYLSSFEAVHEKDPQQLEKYLNEIQKEFKNFEDFYSSLNRNTSIVKSLEVPIVAEAYQTGLRFIEIWHSQFVPLVRQGKNDEANHLLVVGDLKTAFQEHRFAVEKAVKTLRKEKADIENKVNRIYDYSQVLSIIVWLATIIFSILLSYFFSRSIKGHLENTLHRIYDVSNEINAHMEQQAKSVAQQSSSVHETTSAMDELNTSFQHTEILAQESSNRAKNALTVSEEGNQLTKQMLKEMMEHKEKVLAILNQILHLSEIINQIHNVASTINNLTNQTNILALNAAVQAAHAKQSSEGFSVIASEIRKLADESKKFVTHIDVLAGNIKQATDATVHIAEQGGKTVQDSIKLAESSAKAFDTIISITTNSFEGAEQVSLNVRQQGQAVHQVLEAMEILNETAHQNLAGMQQVKGELEKLNELAKALESII